MTKKRESRNTDSGNKKEKHRMDAQTFKEEEDKLYDHAVIATASITRHLPSQAYFKNQYPDLKQAILKAERACQALEQHGWKGRAMTVQNLIDELMKVENKHCLVEYVEAIGCESSRIYDCMPMMEGDAYAEHFLIIGNPPDNED